MEQALSTVNIPYDSGMGEGNGDWNHKGHFMTDLAGFLSLQTDGKHNTFSIPKEAYADTANVIGKTV